MATETQSPASTNNDSSNGGNTFWSNTSNIISSNDSYATTNGNTGDESYYLTAKDFGFIDFDTDATINSITVRIERKRIMGTAIADYRLHFIISDTIETANNHADATVWGTTEAYADHVINTNLPTAAQLKSTQFGVALSVKDASAMWAVQVDHIEIVVDYTPYTQLPCTLQLLGCGT